jgi:hypothetical protein
MGHRSSGRALATKYEILSSIPSIDKKEKEVESCSMSMVRKLSMVKMSVLSNLSIDSVLSQSKS